MLPLPFNFLLTEREACTEKFHLVCWVFFRCLFFRNGPRGVTRALIEGGGGGYIHIFVFCPISFEIKFISKEISLAEHEYMNIPPPPCSTYATEWPGRKVLLSQSQSAISPEVMLATYNNKVLIKTILGVKLDDKACPTLRPQTAV